MHESRISHNYKLKSSVNEIKKETKDTGRSKIPLFYCLQNSIRVPYFSSSHNTSKFNKQRTNKRSSFAKQA